MRLAWLTDLHLDFAPPMILDGLFAHLQELVPDAVVITGDIAEAPGVCRQLDDLESQLACPIHFVLGNHDFYRGSFAQVRDKVRSLCSAAPNLNYLTDSSVVPLTDRTGLVGHDGWGDARLGTPERWKVALSDWEVIDDLRLLDEPRLLRALRQLGDDAAAHFRRVLPAALERFPELIVATHVPPFREACWHEGRISDDDWLPHFTCKAVGDVLAETMSAHPDRQMTVLCGHSHGQGESQILPNLHVLTGGAVYGRPKVQRILEVAG